MRLKIKTNPQAARLEFSDAIYVARWCIAKGHPTLYDRRLEGTASLYGRIAPLLETC
jgi:hypothetical protein